MNLNEIYCADIIDFLQDLLDQFGKYFFDLSIADPPYFIGKAEWDKNWKDLDEYLGWCKEWLVLKEKLLKRTGSFYLFHNDFLSIVEIQNIINKFTDLNFMRLITWNKRFEGSKDYHNLTRYVKIKNKRNYEKMREFILFYTFQDLYKIQDYLNEFRKKNNYTLKDINRLWGHPDNSGIAGHYFSDRSQPQFIIKEKYNVLKKEWNLPLDYENLYGNYIFNNLRTHHSVWNYEIAESIEIKISGNKRQKIHITPKPIDLIKNILEHSSNPDSIILVLFSGSGNVEISCRDMGRKFIGCDNNQAYVSFANKRLKSRQLDLGSFMVNS